jgi:hypothetical protein
MKHKEIVNLLLLEDIKSIRKLLTYYFSYAKVGRFYGLKNTFFVFVAVLQF